MDAPSPHVDSPFTECLHFLHDGIAMLWLWRRAEQDEIGSFRKWELGRLVHEIFSNTSPGDMLISDIIIEY